EGVEKCHFGDSNCLIKSINNLIKHYPKGIPEIGLPPLDFLHFPDTGILNSPYRGPIWMTFYNRDNVNKGFENATITHVEGFLRDPNQKQIVIKARVPRVLHEATFDIAGRVLLFVANSTGRLQSDFQNFHLTLTIKGVVEYRNNRRYLKVYDLVPRIDTDRWIIQFEDLYKENLDITIFLNRVFNEHWLEFWNELQPSLTKAFSAVFTTLLNGVFENVPYDEMFLPELDIRSGF
ncbi:hypothetical protein KR009_001267, partial [Drosophila setifemur]